MTVRVYPGAKNPTHEISLSDGVQTWGLRLAGGEKAIKETPIRPSSIKQMNEGSKFGDWEPGMSQIEQRSWAGGRGVEDFVENNIGFYDSMMAWTILPGKLLPAPHGILLKVYGKAMDISQGKWIGRHCWRKNALFQLILQ